MSPFQSSFHADSEYGNRLHEERFQWFLCSAESDNDLKSIERSDLEEIVKLAKADPSNNSKAVMKLTEILATSLHPRAYDKYIDETGDALIRLIFFDDFVCASDNVSVDFGQTKKNNYPKYRLFKFASFLDILHPGFVRWRGQAESQSIQLAERGLEHFEKTSREGRVALLARWIQRPGPTAFSAKQEIRSRTTARRLAFLLKVEHLTAWETAQQLDANDFKPSRGYTSHVEHYQKNPNSFQAMLSKQRSDARKMSKSKVKLS
jgi:hypothetical protein